MFKKIISLLIFGLVALSNHSFANDSKPVMIIRFNSDFVSYDRQLSKIVDSVKEIKSNADFDLVHVVQKGKKTPNKNIDRIVEKLASEGVEKNNINTSKQPSLIAKYEEVHIFVR